MSIEYFRILPEGISTDEVVDDPEFTEVTRNGEVYTLFRIIRITHEATDHPEGWTHLANVARVRSPAIGVAHLKVIDRVIEDAKVMLSATQR